MSVPFAFFFWLSLSSKLLDMSNQEISGRNFVILGLDGIPVFEEKLTYSKVTMSPMLIVPISLPACASKVALFGLPNL